MTDKEPHTVEELAGLVAVRCPPQVERPTLHYTELPPDTTDSAAAREWNFYLREVGRLLAEGHEGKWVLIKAAAIVGMWDSWEEALAVARQRFPSQSVLIHQVQRREPVLRGPTFTWLWRR